MMPMDRAKQRVKFFDQYRSYVINYNLGKDLVKRYVESHGGTADQPAKRWAEFEKLLSSPGCRRGCRLSEGFAPRTPLASRRRSPAAPLACSLAMLSPEHS